MGQSFPPLKTEAPKSGLDALAERIERHVEEMIEQSLAGKAGRPKARSTHPLYGHRIELLLLVLTILLIVWLETHPLSEGRGLESDGPVEG